MRIPKSHTASQVEIIPPEEASHLSQRRDQSVLDKLVQQRVAEVLANRDEFVLEPFFRTRQVAYEIRRLQTVPERKKWTVFYERNGCLHCGTKDRRHASLGMCDRCHGWTSAQLSGIVRELTQEKQGG